MKPCGVYIAYPFCSQKCTFCNFASGVLPRDLEPRYLAALRVELTSFPWPCAPDSVYLGGGTPSQIDPEALAPILSVIPGDWTEATIECAPGSITAEKAKAWRKAGINRASLGVQSFVRSELARTGRKHSAETVAADVAILRDAGIDHINLDLIAGLPGQNPASWQQSLDGIKRLAPDHASIYMLEVDEESRLGKEMLLGGVRYGASDVPSENTIADFYDSGVEQFAAVGLLRYEISNFAQAGCESLHNLKYWQLAPYFGFGSDAHSFDGVWRWQNVENAADYVSLTERSESTRIESTAANSVEERFFVGLRLSAGIRPDVAEWQRYAEPIHRFLEGGLLETDGQTLRLTDRGVLLSNEVFAQFI